MTFATAVVVGAGTMGQGIAQLLVEAGLTVRLHDATPEIAAAAVATVQTRLDRRRERGEVAGDGPAIEARLLAQPLLADLGDVDLVVESVPERPELKRAVLHQLELQVPATTVIATNTSGLDVAVLAAALTHPERFLGLHFFNPPPMMPLIEIVAAPQTSPETLVAADALARRLGKTPVRVDNQPGFVVNRVLFAMIAEAIRTVEDGVASADDVDLALRLGASHPIGPLALADFIGLDVVLDILESLASRLGPRYAPPRSLRQRVADGHLGRKTGHGFFDH